MPIFKGFQRPGNPYQGLGDSGSLNGSHLICTPGYCYCLYSCAAYIGIGGMKIENEPRH